MFLLQGSELISQHWLKSQTTQLINEPAHHDHVIVTLDGHSPTHHEGQSHEAQSHTHGQQQGQSNNVQGQEVLSHLKEQFQDVDIENRIAYLHTALTQILFALQKVFKEILNSTLQLNEDMNLEVTDVNKIIVKLPQRYHIDKIDNTDASDHHEPHDYH